MVVRREDGSLVDIVLGSATHDYFNSAWFGPVIRTGQAGWSEPYYDESGAKTQLVTYAHPVYDPEG